ncbi:hypothetical protein [Bdellovibrio sp. HCB274]|uniref:hypothetical protein n=1 Tax=Bdellovibrio sp. HCB274 TaxID=3394361 RepID=UPI0039B48AFE
MAKIILVSKNSNGTTWQLAQALRSQQHDVTILTSHGDIPPENTNGIEYMGYFKKWSVLEGLKIIPGLFGMQPHILHLVLDDDRMNAAQVILSTYAKSHPNCVLTTTLLHIKRGLKKTNPVRYLVEESDIITFPTVESLAQLRGLNVRSTQQGRGILPPALNFKNSPQSVEELDESESSLLANLHSQEYFVLPFREGRFKPESDRFQSLLMLARKHKVILWGTYSHWSLRERKQFANWMEKNACADRWIVTGTISPQLSKILLAKSTAFVMAGQQFTPPEMTEYYLRAIQAQSTLILDSKQTSLHADLWKNTVNCWVLNFQSLQKELDKLLTRSSFKLPQALTEDWAQSSHIVDSSMNELNRLYNRALASAR